MLLADARIDSSETFVGVLNESSVAALQVAFATMEAAAAKALANEFGAREVHFQRDAEMRFQGQRHNIRVPVSGLKDTDALRAAFEDDYKRRYGHAEAGAPAEFQALHLSAFAKLERPDIARLPRGRAGAPSPAPRPVYFRATEGPVETQIFERTTLAPGFHGEGPAVIEEYGSTTLIWPGDRFEIGELGEIRISCGVARGRP
ncbi:MAG: hypothetical protein V3T02_08475 [Alphaproteobacteria bacterium]